MTKKKISELTSATTLNNADVIPLVQSGATKKVSIETIQEKVSRDYYPSNVGTRIFGGRMGVVDNNTPKTYQVTVALAQHFDAVRVVFANTNVNIAMGPVRPIVSVMSSLSDVNNNSGTWVTAGKNNNSSFAIQPARQTGRIGYTTTDWIPLKSIPRTDGGTYPLLCVRAYILYGTGNLPAYGDGTDDFTNWASEPDGRVWIARQDNGDKISTPSSFTSTTNQSKSPIVGVQYLSRGRVISLMAVGDSITDGRGTYLGAGFGFPISKELGDINGTAIEYSNCGWSSQTDTIYGKRALDILESELKPDILLFPSGSPNGVPSSFTNTIIANQRNVVQKVISRCHDNNVKLCLWTMLPANSSVKPWGSSDSLRIAANQELLSTTARGFYVADTSTAMSGVVDGTGQMQLLAGTHDDGIHPNDNGYTIMKNVIKSVVSEIIGV